MNSVDLDLSAASEDTSLDSGSEFTCVTETQCEISEDLLNSDSPTVSSTESSSESQEIPKSSENKRELPDMTSPYWYTSKCFSRYWKHYQKVMTWYQKHLQVYRNLQQKYSRQNSTAHSESQRPKSKRNHKKRKRRLPKQRARKLRVDLSDSNASSGKKDEHETRGEEPMSGAEAPVHENELSETDEYEMEITDEMLEFFAKSQQHRKDRDAKDKENGGNKAAEMVNIEDAHKPVRTVEPPKERPGVRRTAEMKLLYGNGAAMIHGMETALKMTYDRNLDVKQPKVWPNIPLRIVFAD